MKIIKFLERIDKRLFVTDRKNMGKYLYNFREELIKDYYAWPDDISDKDVILNHSLHAASLEVLDFISYYCFDGRNRNKLCRNTFKKPASIDGLKDEIATTLQWLRRNVPFGHEGSLRRHHLAMIFILAIDFK